MLLEYFIGFLVLVPLFAVLSSSTVRGYLLILWRRWIGFPQAKLTPTEQAMRSIAKERQAQAAKWGRGVFPSAGLGFGGAEAKEREARAKAACDAAMAEGRYTFAHVLREEVAELLATETHADALTEAVQVGAVVVKLIEYLRNYDSIAVRPLRVYVTAEGPSKLIAATLASTGTSSTSHFTAGRQTAQWLPWGSVLPTKVKRVSSAWLASIRSFAASSMRIWTSSEASIEPSRPWAAASS